MSISNGELSAADIAAITDNNSNGWSNDGSWWIIILFLFAFAGGWNGNGGYGNGGEIQRGFDQSAIINDLSAMNTAISNGFANAEISKCNNQQNLLQSLTALGTAQQMGFNGVSGAIADLKYTIATENCEDRAAYQQGVQAIITNQNNGVQTILDKMCQQELEAERRENQNLRTQLNLANLAQSQNAQTAQLLADNAAQTQVLEQYLNPAPIPAYVVQNPNCCTSQYNCGCGYGSL